MIHNTESLPPGAAATLAGIEQMQTRIEAEQFAETVRHDDPLVLAAGRHGSWVSCRCGWVSRVYENVASASAEWAAHVHHHAHNNGPWRRREDGAMTEPDYVVIRPAADLPEGFLPKEWDGLWIDRSEVRTTIAALAVAVESTALAGATGRFEVRDDGAVAEVFEVRP